MEDDIEFESLFELRYTDFNTVVGYLIKEQSIIDFLKTMKKNKNNYGYSIQYDNIKKCFIINYKYDSYYLKLDDQSMKNYEIGKYNDITYEFKKLVDFFDKRKKEEDEINQKKETYDDIIRRGENGEKLVTLEEKQTYLDYLKKYNKKIIPTIIKMGSILLASLGGTVFGFTLLAFDHLMLSFIVLSISVSVAAPAAGLMTINISELIRKNSINKLKIEQLEKESSNKKIKSVNIETFDKTLENPVKEDLNNFSNHIMKEFNDLLNRINYLNSDNKNELLYKVQLLMDEYINRYKAIVYKKKENHLTLDKDDLEKLKIDITRKISNLESELVDVREKDIQIEQILKEKELLDKKIKDSYEEEKVTMTR